jgi:hypothetical protein
MERIDSKKDELCCKNDTIPSVLRGLALPKACGSRCIESVGEGGRRGGEGLLKTLLVAVWWLAKNLPSVGCNWF